MRTWMYSLIAAVLLTPVTSWAQGGLLMGPPRQELPAGPVLEMNVQMDAEGMDALGRLIMQCGAVEGEVLPYGDVMNLRFMDSGSALRFLQALAPSVAGMDPGDDGWVRVPITMADPRHVRAVIGSDAIPGGEPIEVACRMNPPEVLLRGPELAVNHWANVATQLDVRTPGRPSPEAVVRMYLERWLILPEDGVTPDFEGMYALTVSDEPINLAEFSTLISRTLMNRPPAGGMMQTNLTQSISGYTGWLNPEITAVYEANVDMGKGIAVVPYSLTWFPQRFGPIWGVNAPQHNELYNARQGAIGGSGAAAGGYAAGLGGAAGTRQQFATSNASSHRTPAGLHRGYALVVRGRDGFWRLPMSFDVERQTWLTPLSSTLAERDAPQLLVRMAEDTE